MIHTFWYSLFFFQEIGRASGMGDENIELYRQIYVYTQLLTVCEALWH